MFFLIFNFSKESIFYCNARKVAECHPELDTIHLGCDEVWSLGQSQLTRDHMEKMSLSITDIFLDHVAAVASIAKTLVPEVKVDYILHITRLVVVWRY